MATRLFASRNSRRADITGNQRGFTLIELLVVGSIIGVLTAIALPVSVGVQNNAKDAGVKSDLANAKTAILSLQNETGTMPVTAADIATLTGAVNYGYTKSPNTTAIRFTNNSETTFCIAATSSTGAKFYVTENLGITNNATTAPSSGTCNF